MATKRTYQPSKRRRVRKFGFRARNKSHEGRATMKRRMLKGRKRISL